MKWLLILTVIFLCGCASASQKRNAEWEQAYAEGKLSYAELQQLKMQNEQARSTRVAGILASQHH